MNDPYLYLTNQAALYLGVHEEGGNNRGSMVEDFQRSLGGAAVGQPWCAAFVDYCLKQVESLYQIPTTLKLSELVMALWTDNRKARRTGPKPGYLALWRHRGSYTGHTGIVVDCSYDVFHTIEGNTSSGDPNERDGDGVYRKAHIMNPTGGLELLGFLDPYA